MKVEITDINEPIDLYREMGRQYDLDGHEWEYRFMVENDGIYVVFDMRNIKRKLVSFKPIITEVIDRAIEIEEDALKQYNGDIEWSHVVEIIEEQGNLHEYVKLVGRNCYSEGYSCEEDCEKH